MPDLKDDVVVGAVGGLLRGLWREMLVILLKVANHQLDVLLAAALFCELRCLVRNCQTAVGQLSHHRHVRVLRG